jgi:hypothetical protein
MTDINGGDVIANGLPLAEVKTRSYFSSFNNIWLD